LMADGGIYEFEPLAGGVSAVPIGTSSTIA
jgi:hypothetical protein